MGSLPGTSVLHCFHPLQREFAAKRTPWQHWFKEMGNVSCAVGHPHFGDIFLNVLEFSSPEEVAGGLSY